MRLHFLALLLVFPVLGATQARAQEASPAAPGEPWVVTPSEWLVLDSVDGRGRRPLRPDAVFARYLLQRDAAPPAQGETLSGERGEAAWKRAEVNAKGRLEGGYGWAQTTLEWERDEVVMASLSGAWTLFVNGAGFSGDAYRYGFEGFPIALKKGTNSIFVTGRRGAHHLVLREAPAAWFVGRTDVMIPDLRFDAGGVAAGEFAVGVVNASRDWVSVGEAGRELVADGALPGSVSLPFPLPPLALAERSFAFHFAEDSEEPPHATVLALLDGEPTSRREVEFRTAGAQDRRLVTFVSEIDGSLQEFGVLPAADETVSGDDIGLVISCHGASVPCRNQINAYAPRPDLWIVTPTNRRPYGFDWQDWGRLDAYEVLARALELSGASESRVYLTGHSMGGHGAWHLAANDPDRWAAVAPSAGWASFDTYGGRPEGEWAEAWHAADGASLTFELIENLAQLPTFVLHGDKDDNVPPSEAQAMIAALEAAGAAPRSHFQEGAGHWWDGEAAAGADCLTWPGIYELFDESRRPDAPLAMQFKSVDPVVDADHFALHVHQPLEYGRPFEVSAEFKPDEELVLVETQNVRALRITPCWGTRPTRYEIDGHVLEAPGDDLAVFFQREDSGWKRVAGCPAPEEKGPQRSGPFKRAFDRRFVLVTGSAGSDAENLELLERARNDSATWMYRAGGWVDVVRDVDFLAGPAELRDDRNVILYGNADTNSAWSALIPADCPVQAERDRIAIGEREWEGDDLLCAFVYPRRGDAKSLVGVLADSGVTGTRLGYDLGHFISGVGMPDVVLVDRAILSEGDAGVRSAGWFDHEWKWYGGLRPEDINRGAGD